MGGSVICSVYIFKKRSQVGCKNTGQYFTFLLRSSFLYFQLDVLENWSNRNGKKFISTKCIIIHLGSNNMNICFNLRALWLEMSKGENDLSVLAGHGITMSNYQR